MAHRQSDLRVEQILPSIQPTNFLFSVEGKGLFPASAEQSQGNRFKGLEVVLLIEKSPVSQKFGVMLKLVTPRETAESYPSHARFSWLVLGSRPARPHPAPFGLQCLKRGTDAGEEGMPVAFPQYVYFRDRINHSGQKDRQLSFSEFWPTTPSPSEAKVAPPPQACAKAAIGVSPHPQKNICYNELGHHLEKDNRVEIARHCHFSAGWEAGFTQYGYLAVSYSSTRVPRSGCQGQAHICQVAFEPSR